MERSERKRRRERGRGRERVDVPGIILYTIAVQVSQSQIGNLVLEHRSIRLQSTILELLGRERRICATEV